MKFSLSLITVLLLTSASALAQGEGNGGGSNGGSGRKNPGGDYILADGPGEGGANGGHGEMDSIVFDDLVFADNGAKLKRAVLGYLNTIQVAQITEPHVRLAFKRYSIEHLRAEAQIPEPLFVLATVEGCQDDFGASAAMSAKLGKSRTAICMDRGKLLEMTRGKQLTTAVRIIARYAFLGLIRHQQLDPEDSLADAGPSYDLHVRNRKDYEALDDYFARSSVSDAYPNLRWTSIPQETIDE